MSIPVSTVPADLINAYQRTGYRVHDDCQEFVLRVDAYSDLLRMLHTRYNATSSAFITAYNPDSKLHTPEQNTSRQQHLETDLIALGYVLIPVTGLDPQQQWPPEPGFLAIGISRDDAFSLGSKYGQNAILFSGADAVPGLVLLR